jgi:predicted metallo-beta-lactamase superfamily hydrolase
MATKQQRLATNLKSAQDGLDQGIACIKRIVDTDWGELLADHHVANLQSELERMQQARELVHDVLKDPTGKDDL